jgi:ABC-type dipeptide/oligopeptide/nickel transport system permease subunit
MIFKRAISGAMPPLIEIVNGKLFRNWSMMARIGLSITVFMILIAIFGRFLMTHDPYAYSYQINELPNHNHLLGTDDQGQDVLSRLLLGAQLSLVLGFLAAILALGMGAGVTLLALAIGKPAEFFVFAVVDLIRALPGILFALAFIVALEPGTGSVIIALGVSFSPYFARITRATYYLEMTKPYTTAARAFGASRLRIAFRHVLPNIFGALVTQFAIILPRCIVSESVLSFLGLGVSPETPTWGRMIANASSYVEEAPHVIIIPVIALAILTFGFAMIGDELRRRFDPAHRKLTT